MEKRLVLVALVTLALGCGETQGVTDDAGSDAEAVDLGGLDVAVDDAGEDAGAAQCTGMPDLSPCDDGRVFTVDACIGGVCVGRSCSENQVPRACNTPRLTLTSCEGVPFEDGTVCDDGDAFTTNDECTGGVCGGDPCPCPPGEPCCTGSSCQFLPDTADCDEWIAIECIGPSVCGRDYDAQLHRVFCSGSSPACNGAHQVIESAVVACDADRRCVSGSYVQPNDDDVNVTIGCVPSC